MSKPQPEHLGVRATIAGRQLASPRFVLLAIAVAFCVVRAPLLLLLDPHLDTQSRQSLSSSFAQAQLAVSSTRGELLQRAVGIPEDIEAMLRQHLGPDGRLVLYLPYKDPAMVVLLRLQYERLKNLLYPTPRDTAFANSQPELASYIDAQFHNRMIVVDGTQEPVPLPVDAEFEQIAEQPLGGGGVVRYWLLRKVGK